VELTAAKQLEQSQKSELILVHEEGMSEVRPHSNAIKSDTPDLHQQARKREQKLSQTVNILRGELEVEKQKVRNSISLFTH
jgi:hypothetical protein